MLTKTYNCPLNNINEGLQNSNKHNIPLDSAWATSIKLRAKTKVRIIVALRYKSFTMTDVKLSSHLLFVVKCNSLGFSTVVNSVIEKVFSEYCEAEKMFSVFLPMFQRSFKTALPRIFSTVINTDIVYLGNCEKDFSKYIIKLKFL